MPFYYVMVVWGESYVGMLLDLALPTFLAPHNLPALSNLNESRFVFVTTPADRLRIEASPIFHKLRDVIEPVFIEPEWMSDDTPYYLKAARGHRMGAEAAAAAEGYCIYLCPDCLISDGSFLRLETLARAGKEAVMTTGLRLVTETVYEELRVGNRLAPGRPLVFTGRELAGFGLRHLHPEVQRYYWDHPHFTLHPQLCIWPVPGEEGVVIRAFHLHPIMVSMKGVGDLGTLDISTIDGDFLGNHVTDWDRIHVETDSDNFLIFSLTGAQERLAPPYPNRPDVREIGKMAYNSTVNPLHRSYFPKAIRLHAGEVTPKWAEVEAESGGVVYPVLNCSPLNAPVPLIEAPLGALVNELGKRIRRRAARTLRRLGLSGPGLS